jgi:hypothetical protein
LLGWGKTRKGANEGIQTLESYVNERLDHLGVVAGVCQEIGLIELLHIRSTSDTQSLVLRLQPMHRLVLALLGPPYEHIYQTSS